jgi:hypothetical protein
VLLAASPMNFRRILSSFLVLPCLAVLAAAQAAPSNAPVSSPVSYASISALNVLLTQLQQAAKSTQADLAGLRIEKWKTDSNSKRLAESNVESIRRNLQEALPAIIGELQAAPESLPATFKLYRNLDALYDVFTPIVESAGAFGSKDDFQSLDTDLSQLEKVRRSFADRLDVLASAKESELTRLRTEVQKAEAAAAAAPPKKIIIDDTEPVKKPAKKKPTGKTTKKPAAKSSTPPPEQK